MFNTTYSVSDVRAYVGCTIRQSTFATLPARIIEQARAVGCDRVEISIESTEQVAAAYVHWLRRHLAVAGIHLIGIRAIYASRPPFRAVSVQPGGVVPCFQPC